MWLKTGSDVDERVRQSHDNNLKDTKKLPEAAESGDRCLWVHPISHDRKTFDPFLM